MIAQRVEKHLIKHNSPFYSMFCDFTHKSKNLYNHANYLVRSEFVKNDKWLRYGDMDKLLKADLEFDDYKQMPTAQSAQQILRLLEKDWKSFFTAIKDWSKHKDKYLGRPKLPSYKPKDGRHLLILTNQNVKLKGNVLCFPKAFNGFALRPRFVVLENFQSFQQARIIPGYRHFVVELVYNINVPDTAMDDNGKYLSIDIGVDNLATITNNIGKTPVVINGKGLKSMNQYYNKMISHYREVAKKMNDSDFTNKMAALTRKRNHKIDDYMHKASRYVIEYAVSMGTNTIVVGHNKEWKQDSKLSKAVNQSFVGIPQKRFIEMVQYKAQDIGLNVILQEESYTSGTSFLDKEEPVKANYNKSRRVSRGLFVSNNGIKINADINGSYQILMKVFPNAFAEGIEGVALHPVRVNVA
ncbi:RNA-guided endonuclease InsQ/TnpB family protein [Oribacterium sp. WCC10]|uniref:RNA-guided endonuclease InsQ/TnpB family protein n=2 Tax=unclassified Oribacterium TaxID=2629782 RepID=UPI0008E0C182|nr:RNA-guided endonuclease TnpB family protein [Oribacterium sp. WCC10]SFG60510.1 putative transposase [Oribacterium sp. WCC10]